MFNIAKYSHDQISDITEIKVFYCLKPNGKIVEDGGSFTTKSTADNWLQKVKRDYFFFKLENFLIHKKHILENSHKQTNLENKKNILQELKYNFFLAVEKWHLNEACKWLINEQEKFQKILPGVQNPSYDSSVQELAELTKFAKEQTKHTTLKQAS